MAVTLANVPFEQLFQATMMASTEAPPSRAFHGLARHHRIVETLANPVSRGLVGQTTVAPGLVIPEQPFTASSNSLRPASRGLGRKFRSCTEAIRSELNRTGPFS